MARTSPVPAAGRSRLPRLPAWFGSAALAALILAIPLATRNPYAIDVASSVCIYITLALGLNVVVGYAGLLDLGYSAFFAVGAYTTGILSTAYGWNFWATLPVSVLLSAIAGIIIGTPTLRLRSDYLAIVTLGFGEIIRITAMNLNITGGPSGIFGIPAPRLFGVELLEPRQVYWLLAGLMLLSLVAVARLGSSRVGRAWACIREDEDAAEAMGVNTLYFKLLAYITGAIFAGLTGSIYGVKMTAIAPESFSFMQSVTILMAVVLGGLGSVRGAVLGAALIVAIPELLRGMAQWRLFGFGLALILLMLFRPQGLWPARSPEEGGEGHATP